MSLYAAFNEAVTTVMPYFNLVLVVIVVLLFTRLFTRKFDVRVYKTPWILLFFAVGIFVVEEVMTILRLGGIISYPYLVVHGFFEMGMVTLFIYMLLLQKEYIKTHEK